jgi:predicted O-linked N-acetylglucosamine transferase (SPINDLY family)
MRHRRFAKSGKKIPVQPEISGPSKIDYAATLQNALMLHQQGRLDEAEALYREIVCVEPNHFNALQLLAAVVAQKKNALEAIGLFDKALNINPCHLESLNNRGNSLRELYRFEEALASYDQAIALNPDYVDAYSNRGLALTELQRYDEALLSYDQAIALNADYAVPYFNRGNLLLALKRYDEALLSYEHSLALKPDDADVYNNSGLALTELKRYDEALLSYDQAIALNADYAEPYFNRGNLLLALKRYDEALLSYDRALVFKPDYTRVYYNRGIVLTKLKRYEEVLSSYEHALAISPGYHFLFGMCLHTQMLMCEWKAFDKQGRQLVEKIEHHEKASPPFALLAIADSLFVQKEAAEIFIQEKFPSDNSLPQIPRRTGDEKIRIGYYSADFYDHATAYLMAELFEQHDRELFELIAFSYGHDTHDDMRKRVVAAFDRFIDVRNQSDTEVALLSREMEIDIAVDLKGFTGGSRLGIFALRAAPIQVSYLGYPGTTGAEYIDYLIADRTLVPESSWYGYTEKIVSLPDSYQVNDTKRCIAEKVFTREESGLPEFGFVFSCFNNNFKITPFVFDGWMRILKQAEGSVLWLLEDNPKAASNLRREATERGVNADRLIFAKRLPLPEHLARHRSADLFLDTFPCNAHTTASDALWAGLPVLTLSGESFASRVAASLLNALHLPELITSRQEEYEALAIELAMSPEKLGKIRQKLEKNRLTAPLFDTQRFTRHLEEAYRAMYERYQQGLLPEHMALLPSTQGRRALGIKDGNSPIPGDERHGAVVTETAVPKAEPQAVSLQAALEHHQQGRLDEAEALYREIVCLQPEHVDALQLLATIAAQRKDFAEAVSLFNQAFAINPSHPLLLNNLGNALQALKRYDEAIVNYDRALALNPAYAEAHFNRGVVLKELKRCDEAIMSYDKAIAANSGYAEAYYNCGNALQELKRYDDAVLCYERALTLKPQHAKSSTNLGNALQELKRYDEAVLCYERALTVTPDDAELYFSLGIAFDKLKRYDDAVLSYDKSIALDPEGADAYNNRGVALKELKRYDEAMLSYDKAIVLKPEYAEAYFNRGNVLTALGRYGDAMSSYEMALAVKPDDAMVHVNRGVTLHELKRYCDAVLSYDKSIALDPEGADAYNNRGVALKELKRYDEAMLSYDKAIALKPEYAEAYSNRGNVLTALGRYGDAMSSYEMALAVKPDDAMVHVNRGVTLHELKRYREAALSYGKALLIKPDYDFLFAERLNLLMRICDWSDFDQDIAQLYRKIEGHEKVATPFPVLALLDSPALQKEVAMNYVQEKYPEQHLFPAILIRERHDRIRIGYYSADFHNHATVYLMAELFEQHDRSCFELFAFSFGPDKQDEMRKRVSVCFDRFIDVRTQTDHDVALLSRTLEIDIAVDLKGFTQDSRTGIFALRAAPIQVNYLGYPGTMGAEYIDYLIADQIVIPESNRQFYTEKIVSLPDSYQVNDAKRRIAERIFTREELGLPKRGFVFCCFNNNYKINPATFDGWMRILSKVPESIIWLLEDNPEVAEHLSREAVQRGVDSSRLIFAKRMLLPDHLARHRLADLFLDTFPCNAHTTASDALWAGLPVLTLTGESFASRVAASLLNAVEMPELITSRQDEYEALAIALATNPEKLRQIRHKLGQNRLTAPLFDTQRFTRHLEEAYSAMYERYQEGLSPEHMVLLPSVQSGKLLRIKDRQPPLPSGEYHGAVVSEMVVPLEPRHAPSLQSALQLHQQGRLDEAEALYKEILCSQPRHFDALRLMATIAAQREEFGVAVALFDQAININPNHPNSFNNQGVAFQKLQRYDEALGCFEKALALKPDYAEAYANYENVLQELKRADAAFVHDDSAFAFKPAEALIYSNQGNEIQKSERYEEALLYYDKALALIPDYDEAHFNRAIALKKLKRYHEALLSYDRVLALKPDYAEAYSNRGNVLTALGRCDEAVLSYERALALRPDYARAYVNRGVALQELKQYDEAILSYDKALALQPDYDFLFAECLFLKMRMCEWSDFEQQVSHLCRKIERHEKVSTPFPVLAMTDSLLLQKEAALIYVGAKHAHALSLETIAKRARHDKIRIGYYSADFHNHATSYLMAELFETHDRRRFELFAFSFGPERHDGMRERISASFDHFIDVRTHSDRDVAQLSRSLEIDIAVDLKGFTTDSRTGIFALRAAPIQVNYLGYPGTMGADYLDYLIADATLIAESSQTYYTEKIVYLPDSYQVNDRKRRISEMVFTREELGLPETGFVFSCFNNNYKINPAVFDSWMRILGHVKGSVLWLFEDNPQAAENLRQEAVKRGIESERLIFARRIPPQEHLARHRSADLFLDTFPCNAHTTASDALWAGLPLLTLTGESFAGRVAASLLNAMQLPELITSTQEEYEALAIALATNPEKLGQIRHKLEQNRFTTPLFDTRLFTWNLEEAYRMMYERYQADLPPEHLVVRRVVSTQDTALLLRSALLMHQQGRLGEAEALYKEIVQSYPEHFDALRLLAIIAVQQKKFQQSLVLFDQVLSIHPDHATSLNNQGVAFQELHRFDDALCCYDKALAVKADYAEASLNRGVVLQELGRFGEAVLSYDKALAGNADNARIWFHRGNVLQELKRFEEALLNYERALAIKADYAAALSNRGIALMELKRHEEAVLSYEKALAINPDYAIAYANLGNVLQDLKRFSEAVLRYDKAIVLNPYYALAYSNRGVALQELKRYEEALLSFDRALLVKPDYAEAYSNRAAALKELKRYEEALASYEQALALKPDYEFLSGMCLNTKMQICDWRDFERQVSRLFRKIERHEKVSTPFSLLSISDSLLLQKKGAMIYVGETYFSPHVPSIISKRVRHDKIRVGYYSADFHDHATVYLMAELFELHDRSRFEFIAFSFGPDRQDEMRKRVAPAFDQFFNVRSRSDAEVALLSRNLEIDIAVDLKGFTQDSRCGIFALRAAPIQVSYLGYPGTMGAGYIDYLIADQTLIPESSRHGYTEKVVYLPDSYQVNDTKRCIAEKLFIREECGLPEQGFVFACFNNNYKITPATFDGWVRILGKVEDSVLWLLEDNVTAANNLRKEAINRGVDAARLVFAKRMPLAEHLARHRSADLFLDTFPCNAHTTASDALWAGLPVLTLSGESFASRVAASLLNAMQLSELITSTQEEYEALAIELATNPDKLRQIRQKLERNRLTTPLFDTPLYTRHIEAAYLAMYEQYQEGLAPEHIFIMKAT